MFVNLPSLSNFLVEYMARPIRKTSGTVEQVNHYYPYGGLMGESTNGDI